MASNPRLIRDPTVTTSIVIGPEQRIFSIHKSLLCTYANYFETAYRTQLREAREDRFVIDDVEPDIFALVFTWLYTGQIHLNGLSLSSPKKTKKDEGDDGDRSCDFEPQVDTTRRPSTGSAAEFEFLDSDSDNDDGGSEYEKYSGLTDSSDEENYPEQDTEQAHIRSVYWRARKNTQPQDLDVYLLESLLKVAHQMPAEKAEEFVPRWTAALESKKAEPVAEVGETSTLENVLETLVELYILADRFDIPLLRRDVIGHLETQRQGSVDDLGPHLPPFTLVSRAYDCLPSTSKLLLWLVHVFAYDWNPDTDGADEVSARKEWPREFLMEVLLLQSRRLPRRLELERAPFDVSMCFYHEHDSVQDMQQCPNWSNEIEDVVDVDLNGESVEDNDVEMADS